MESKKKIRVCRGCSCKTFGGAHLMEKLEKEFGLSRGEKNDKIDLDFSDCMDSCSYAPNVRVDDEVLSMCDVDNIIEKIENATGVKKEKENLDININDNFLNDI